jgi:hypothetical protein
MSSIRPVYRIGSPTRGSSPSDDDIAHAQQHLAHAQDQHLFV